MDKQNVTLSLPRSVLHKAEKIAKDQNQSLSELVAELLSELAEREIPYAEAMRKHLALLAQDTDLRTCGSTSWTRADLHDR
ncbi:MAG: ribbon-helix-helix protein, CopG family [Caldilineaceae bacterium SB0670_bin_27]|uniref:Ribbon-helix-helix protein, CopG family n=1 Tax=Caldilineaceae bacterium SB0664_bin_27 TaxID=2605260 RepID=A0A6B0YX08_9CHLR|nr:ribbon-helix-helix protein, CopG family [Caldilineaceae bacterium SB0664_bin_27]MYJ79889.1 ribbon-helix-helix protein, CopG family [Caldilineaceae bacterium SB0670_bin_27]